MLANKTSYEDSFTTCQITPENHGSLLGRLLNMELESRNRFSGQIFFCKVYWPTPFNMHFDFRPLFRITFAELSGKYPCSQTPAVSRGCTEGKAKTRGLGVWLSQSLTFGNLATATRILLPDPRRQWMATFTYNDYNTQLSRNFRAIKIYFRELEKNFREDFQHNTHGFRN